jgi:DNA polymerase-3 subunit delta'
MAFVDFPRQTRGVALLQRSLERGRLAHAYLFIGQQLDELEALARTLAKTLNCQQPRKAAGVAVDCCDQCLSCQKIEHGNHADIHWARPESKLRVITIDQMRELLQQIHLKTTEAVFKVAIIVGADRLNVQAANAFLKTLEEPPANSVLILLTTDRQRVLETIRSRCLRLEFAGQGPVTLDASRMAWLEGFSESAAAGQKSLLGRYRLMDLLLRKLNELKESIGGALKARSPLEQYEEVDKELRDKWESELSAAIEAEYRRQRGELLGVVQWWLRDVWLQTLDIGSKPDALAPEPSGQLLNFPALAGTRKIAQRVSPQEAMDNLRILEQLQRWLSTNVQEALALEVGLLKLHL